jgi:hypothetical protein
MRKHLIAAGLTALVSGVLGAADASPDLPESQIEQIITKFAAKEAEFQRARGNYTYRQTARVLDLDESGTPVGKWEMISDIVFTPEGQRTERVVRAPVETLKNFNLDPGDIQDLRDVQPFVLTTNEIPMYYIRYLGKAHADEIPCYVFAVKPKKLESGKRYFSGQIWVDDRDLQIVKTYGRGVGLLKHGADNQYPKFETYREQVDGKYWFPTYTVANDTLFFRDNTARIKMTVTYKDYKQFKSDINIKYGDEVSQPQGAKPPAKP